MTMEPARVDISQQVIDDAVDLSYAGTQVTPGHITYLLRMVGPQIVADYLEQLMIRKNPAEINEVVLRREINELRQPER